MKRLNIIKVIDVFGWAYDFVNKEQKKYSSHNIMSERLFDLDINRINSDIDIIYFHAPNIQFAPEMKLISQIDRNKVKIIGAYGGETQLIYNHSDLIVGISYPYIATLKRLYLGKIPIIFLPESIDTKFWNGRKIFNKETFNPGYAGKLQNHIKRTYILDKLNYKITKQAEWGEDFFIKNRNQDNMKEFYKNIDVLLITSKTECMPRVLLEAMACGIPVISTDVGCIRMLLGKEWIISSKSDETIITEMNKKLKLLEKDINLRKIVGNRNRKYVEQYFSWRRTTPLWDKVFESLYINDFEKIIEISNKFIEPFKSLYLNV